jgi:mannose-6-phosphate isomerase-like protein (cupin superfamily)
MGVVLAGPDDGELIMNGPIRIRILEDGTNTGHRIGITENVLAPATIGPPQHIHREHVEAFFVVSGTVRFTSGTEHADVSAGGLLTVPIGVPHTFANPDADEPATFLCTVTPDRYISYFRELGALRPGPGGLDPAVVLAVMDRYATEPYRS